MNKRRPFGLFREATAHEPGAALGDWTLVKRLDNVDGAQTWLVRCACGQEAALRIAVLSWNVKRGRRMRCMSCAQKVRRNKERCGGQP